MGDAGREAVPEDRVSSYPWPQRIAERRATNMSCSYATAKHRRENRTGYVTIEGFWEDPPGYVDNVVWPNYVKDHAFLFENGDVNGSYDEAVCKDMSLHAAPAGAQRSMTTTLSWAFEVIRDASLSSSETKV